MEQILFIIKSIIIGIVEGITEFLPISSTGHMVITQNLLNFQSNTPHYIDMYTYVIQLGAILAVIVLYWKKFKDTLVNFFPSKVGYEKSGFKFWLMIFISCIPGAILGITVDSIAEEYLLKPLPVAIALFVGGILMILAENKFRNTNTLKSEELTVTPKQAIIIGLFQCFAIIPGASRSASTIIGGWVAGLSTVVAAEYSFFLAVPVMVGVSILKLIKTGGLGGLSSNELIALIVGFVVSFIVALVVINKFISYLKKKPMKVFAIYRLIFAVIVLIFGFLGFFKL
jgi:undecaprenyl-diphosphatase